MKTPPTEKKCRKCGEVKSADEFNKCARSKAGKRAQCKACVKAYNQANKEKICEQGKAYKQANKEKISEQGKAYRQANKEKIVEYHKAYYQANKEKISEQGKAHYQANKEKIAEQGKAYRQANKEKIAELIKAWRQENKEKAAEYGKAYYQANKEKMREQMKAHRQANKEKISDRMKAYNAQPHVKERRNQRHRERYKNDPQYKMLRILRGMLRRVLNGKAKTESALVLVGCTTEELWEHLKDSFVDGMTVQNHGEVWHIGHIEPLSGFDPTKDEHVKRVNHFSNLKAQFKEENLSDGAKVPDNHQAGLPLRYD